MNLCEIQISQILMDPTKYSKKMKKKAKVQESHDVSVQCTSAMDKPMKARGMHIQGLAQILRGTPRKLQNSR